jgi:hypothetical protein
MELWKKGLPLKRKSERGTGQIINNNIIERRADTRTCRRSQEYPYPILATA